MVRSMLVRPVPCRLFVITLVLLAIAAASVHQLHSNAQIISFASVTVVSAATFEEGPLAPESLAVAFGDGFATTTVSATATPLPEVLGGTRVLVRDSTGKEFPCGLFFVSPQQINFLVPPGLAAGNALITVITSSGVRIGGALEIAAVAPGLLAANANGQGPALGFLLSVPQSGGQSYEPLARFDEQRKQFVTRPILLNRQTIQTERLFFVLYGTGIHNRPNPASVRAHLGGLETPVDFAGAVPNLLGLDQLNIPIPSGLIGALTGRGRINLAISITTSASERIFSNVLEIEIADRAAPDLTITGLQPARALAGETVTITGAGFDRQAGAHRVRVGGVEAEVIEASPTQLKIKVPFGADSGPVTVSIGNGEAASAQSLAIRTSVSGQVEDTRRRPIIGVTVRAVRFDALGLTQTIASAKTNGEGVFILPDLPADNPLYVQVDASTASVMPRLPQMILSSAIAAGRDNPLARPIAVQIPTGPGIKFNTALALPLVFSLETPIFAASFANDWVQPSGETPDTREAAQQSCDGRTGPVTLELPSNARAFLPCETLEECQATSRTLYVTPVENARTPVKLPVGRYSSTMVQLSPFGGYLSPGGMLSLPNADCLSGSPDLRLFRLLPVQGPGGIGIPGSIFGGFSSQFTEAGTARLSADGQRITTSPGIVNASGIYFVSAKHPTATLTGRVIEPSDSSPIPPFFFGREVRRAIVTARGQEAITDGNGSFILRNVPVLRNGDRMAVEISYLRPNGRVERILLTDIALNANGVTAIPTVTLPEPDANRPPVILASAFVAADENQRTDFNFTVSDADPNQSLQVSMSGPPFAQLINRGGGAYTLRVTPGFDDAGAYTVTLTATDSLGATATHTIALTIANVNQAPTATAQSVSTDEDTAKPIVLTGTDPDRNALQFTLLTQPANGKLTGQAPDLVYQPNANYFGPDSFTFKVNDGLADSRPATVTIAVRSVNDTPLLNVPAEQKIAAGKELKFVVSATDLDTADTVSLSSPDLPTGATFNQIAVNLGFAAQFTWTPNAMQIGTYIVAFRAADNGAPTQSTVRAVAITVMAADAPASTGQWSPTEGGPFGGPVTAFHVNGSNVLAGASAGLFRSTNGGETWSRTGVDTIGSAAIAALANLGNTLFAGTSAGVFRSTDAGATWTEASRGMRLPNSPLTLGANALAVKGTLLFAAAGGTVFASADNAQTWNRADNGLPLPTAAINKLVASGGSLFAAGFANGIYRSTDDGKNWGEVRQTGRLESISALAAFGGTVYAATSGSLIGAAAGSLLASNDNGATWSAVPTRPEISFINALHVTTDYFLAGTADRLYSLRRVPNAPIEAVPVLDKQYILAVASEGSTVFAGTSNGVFRSADKAATWKPVNNGLAALTVYAFTSAGSNLLAGTDNGVFVSDNQGKTWQAANTGLESQFLPSLNVTEFATVTVSGATRVFATETLGRLFSTGDLGKSWQRVEGLPDTSGIYAIGVSGSTLFVSAAGGLNNTVTVYRSTDLGKTWSPASRGLAPRIPTVFASLGNTLFAADFEGVFVSTNNGESWTPTNAGLPETPSIIKLAASGSNIYAGTAGQGVYVSPNNGQSWTPANNLLPPNLTILSLLADGSKLFAIARDDSGQPCPFGGVFVDGRCFGAVFPGPGGFGFGFRLGFNFGGFPASTIYVSLNQGQSWAPVMAGLSGTQPASLGAHGGSVLAGTGGQSVFVRQF